MSPSSLLAFSLLLVNTGLHEFLMNLQEALIKLSLQPTTVRHQLVAIVITT